MAEKNIKVGVIGLGYIAQNVHIPCLISTRGTTITSLCDADENTLREVGALYRIEHLYTDPKQLAEKSDCDCALVLTKPDDSHASISEMLLRNGKDVFCEKPMATRLSEARSMVETAARASKHLMVGFNRRFMPISVKAKEIFASESLDVCKITFNGFKPRPVALLSNPHPVDLLRFFCGDATSVRCCTKSDAAGNEQSITAFVEFDSGAVGILIFNNQAGGYSENVEIHGGGYSVIVDMVSQETKILQARNPGLFNPQEWIEHKPSKWVGFHGGNGFLQQDQHFLECVRTRTNPNPDGADAYKSHELTNIIYRESGLPTFD